MKYLIWVSISIGNRPIDSHLHDDVNAPNTLEYSTPIVNMSWNYPCVKVDFSFNKGTEWILGASLQNMKSLRTKILGAGHVQLLISQNQELFSTRSEDSF